MEAEAIFRKIAPWKDRERACVCGHPMKEHRARVVKQPKGGVLVMVNCGKNCGCTDARFEEREP